MSVPLSGNGYSRYLLARRMVLSILLFSSLVTLLATSLQLYLDYRRDVDQIDSRLREIESSHLKNITSAVWLTHDDLVRTQLEGIMRLPDMVYARVEMTDGDVIHEGEIPGLDKNSLIERRFPLSATFRGQPVPLGEFIVVASLDGVYHRIVDKTLVILATQTVKTFLVSFFILYLFYIMVGRHLHTLAEYTRQVRLHHLPMTPPELHRPPPRHGRLDEIDQLSLAIGDMVEELRISYQQMHESQVMLEESVTQRQAMESALESSELRLRQAEKLEAIGTLAGGIAHDFNNILAIIFGHAEMGLLTALPKEYGRFEAILTASERARELIRQLLAFSRQGELEQEWFSPVATVKEALKFLRATLPATIEIQSRLDEESGVILANPVQIYQVMLNLCTNAAQAMEEQGDGLLEVVLVAQELGETEAKALSLTAGYHLRLTVRDTGSGMSEGVRERIFDPFFTTKAVGKGTGLGLAVVHGVVTRCGGVVTVESAPGEGSVFHVLLPARKSAEEGKEGEPWGGHGGGTGGGHVLLVDDEPQLIHVTQSMLLSLGFTVESYQDPLLAWERYWQEPELFRVVITDQTMPGLSGVDLLGKIRGIRPTVPVIVTTGHSDHVTRDNAGEMGFSSFLAKPFRIRELEQALQEAMA